MLSLCYIVTQKNETFDLLKLLKAHMYFFTNRNNWKHYPKPLLMTAEWA